MFFLIFIFVILAFFKILSLKLALPFDLRNVIAPTTDFLHGICVQQTEHFAKYSEAAAALVCGHQIESLTLQSTFAASGLIHLLVVSGSHLLLIDRGLSFFLKNQLSIRLSLLFIFVLICEMNPPIMRSFTAIVLAELIHSKNWVWSNTFKQWMTTLFCFFINPFWVFSLSFQMSWLASLSLDLASGFYPQDKFKQSLLRILLIYLSFIFVFSFLGFPSLWSPLFALALTPILELILFPLALISTLIPPLSDLFEALFSALMQFIKIFDPEKNFLLFVDQNEAFFFNSVMIIFLLTVQLKFSKVSS